MCRPLCACGNLRQTNGISKKTGKPLYRSICKTCSYKKQNSSRKKYRLVKKMVCELCGFIAEHSCQLDVDHIDGNHQNNDSSNLQTLCANCHRLKTYKNRDFIKKSLY